MDWSYYAFIVGISLLIIFAIVIIVLALPEQKQGLINAKSELNQTKTCQGLILLNQNLVQYRMSDEGETTMHKLIIEKSKEINC